MKHIFLLIGILFLCTAVWAQFDSPRLSAEWREGSIVLNDGTQLSGLIQYNDRVSLVNFKKDDFSSEESFTEKRILGMQFYDGDADRIRRFANFNIQLDETGWQGTMLFEILFEFEDFAVLSRHMANILLREKTIYGASEESNSKVGYEQFEYIAIANGEGKLTIVMALKGLVKDVQLLKIKERATLFKKELKKCLGDHWKEFERLVNANSLDLERRDDFLKSFALLHKSLNSTEP